MHLKQQGSVLTSMSHVSTKGLMDVPGLGSFSQLKHLGEPALPLPGSEGEEAGPTLSLAMH